jgi:hypothetical protein
LTPSSKTHIGTRRAIRKLVFVAGLFGLAIAGTASLWFVLQAAWADATSLSARTTVTEWRQGTGPVVTTELWDRTRSQLQAALQTAPGNAQLHDDLAYLYASRSQGLGNVPIDSPDYGFQQSLMDIAITHYRAACELRPTFPYTWTYLALAKHYRAMHDDEFFAAYDKAVHYGHSEAELHGALAEISYSQWARIGPLRQQAFANMVATAKETSRARLQEQAELAGITLPIQ